jgi:hypothetical protein
LIAYRFGARPFDTISLTLYPMIETTEIIKPNMAAMKANLNVARFRTHASMVKTKTMMPAHTHM